MDGGYFLSFNKIRSLPSFESIRRVRQKFQEEGLYLPNEDVRIARREEEEKMRKLDEWIEDTIV
jgi:hypothetical protein